MVRPFVGHVVAYLFRPKARKFVPLSSAFVLVRPCTGNHGGAMTRSAPDRLFQVERVDLAARERLFQIEKPLGRLRRSSFTLQRPFWTAPDSCFDRRNLIRPGKMAQRGSSRTDTADRCAT